MNHSYCQICCREYRKELKNIGIKTYEEMKNIQKNLVKENIKMLDMNLKGI